MKRLYIIAAILLFGAALIQWLGIGEKVYHAIWQWYKFKDFSNNGHTTISHTMAIVTYGLSILLIGAGLFLVKYSKGTFVNLISKVSTISLILGLLSLSLLILSPLGELVQG